MGADRATVGGKRIRGGRRGCPSLDPDPFASKVGAVAFGALALDGAQANIRTLLFWGEPSRTNLNNVFTKLTGDEVVGPGVDLAAHMGGSIYGGAQIPRLPQSIRISGFSTERVPLTGALGARQFINGVEVPALTVSRDATAMVREAGRIFVNTTQGWAAPDKAAFWGALTRQIEAVHSPTWVATPMAGRTENSSSPAPTLVYMERSSYRTVPSKSSAGPST